MKHTLKNFQEFFSKEFKFLLKKPQVNIGPKFYHFVHFDHMLIGILKFAFSIFRRHVRLDLILGVCSHGWDGLRWLGMPLKDFRRRVAIYFGYLLEKFRFWKKKSHISEDPKTSKITNSWKLKIPKLKKSWSFQKVL